MKGLSEVFLLVWVSGHQCQKWKRESGTDAKGVTGGASVSFVTDGFGVRGKVEPLQQQRMQVEKQDGGRESQF